jgi:Domain of unknown function (DUF4193)
MSEDDFEDAEEFDDDTGEPEFDAELDDELVGDELVGDDLVDDELVVETADDAVLEEDLEDLDVIDDVVPVVTKVRKGDADGDAEDDDDVVDLDEELHPDDVEEALDVVLRERTAKVGLEDDDEEEDEVDDRGDGTKIVPRRPGEFLCSSCFLVLPRNQLADEKNSLCHDCA